MASGDPRKQQRPDGREAPDPAQQMVEAFPPAVSCVATSVACEVVEFPFIGGKAIDLQISSGPMQLHIHFHPEVADAICEEIQAAAANAKSKLQAADLLSLERLAKNGQAA